MFTLETARLIVRPLVMDDLSAVYDILDAQLGGAMSAADGQRALEERAKWLQWTVLGYGQLEKLDQPPYGEEGIILNQSGVLVGLCGLVPCLEEFGRLAALSVKAAPDQRSLAHPEVGLYWAIATAHQRNGYASEAGRALAEFAFTTLRLKRIIATTSHDNLASIAVMKKIGMRIETNPDPEPPWLQVVGILQHPSITSD